MLNSITFPLIMLNPIVIKKLHQNYAWHLFTGESESIPEYRDNIRAGKQIAFVINRQLLTNVLLCRFIE